MAAKSTVLTFVGTSTRQRGQDEPSLQAAIENAAEQAKKKLGVRAPGAVLTIAHQEVVLANPHITEYRVVLVSPG